jgi:hypothetical protein
MTAVTDAAAVPERGTAETLAAKLPFWEQAQSLGYSYAIGQWAVGFWSGLYVLIFQAHYWGRSFKWTWDHLNVLWHFKAIPLIGNWMFTWYDDGRHIFLRDAPEAVLAYSVVAMIITWLATKKYQVPLIRKFLIKLGLAKPKPPKVPLIHRVAVRFGIPSIYQEDMGRHPDTSLLQYVFLIPSMLLASLVGEIPAAVIIFGGIAVAHRAGYSSPWLEPTSPWVPVVIGVAGGKMFGHMPAVKAGYDLQRKYGIGKRLAVSYAADTILDRFAAAAVAAMTDTAAAAALAAAKATARNELTGMRRADPSLLYPGSYRRLYAKLLAAHAPVKRYGLPSAVTFATAVVLFFVVGGWGVYLRKYGISHGFWLPW